MERKLERIRLMRSPASRYFLARWQGVWHLILHGLTGSLVQRIQLTGQLPSATERRPDAAPSEGEDGGPMKITPWYLAALAPFAAIGCSGAYLGHAAVVVLTIGIFLGTLSLGHTPSSPPTQPPTIS